MESSLLVLQSTAILKRITCFRPGLKEERPHANS
jgi:hypothetical protein